MKTNETVADIIAWLRRPREGENAYLTLWRDEIADRIEAAHKRERGDCAKLREVCIYALAELEHFRKCNDSRLHICDIVHVGNAKHALKAALAAPSTAEKSSAVGDAAKLREALSDACYAMFNFLKAQNCGYEEMASALDKAKAALDAPPRNCDRFATIDEAHEEYRGDYIMRASNKFDFPMKFEAWLFAPATEKEEGNDGN